VANEVFVRKAVTETKLQKRSPAVARSSNGDEADVRLARLGFIGAGSFITAHHLATARDSASMAVRGIADLNESIFPTLTAAFAPHYCTTDYRKILADRDVDIVVIGTKDDLHARLIVESLDAGKWVFCEKPMAESQNEADAVLAAEARNPGKLAVGFNRRFSPACIDAKRLMQRTPRPWYINYRLMAPNPDKRKDGNFYAERERILYEGTHILDLVCWLLDARPTQVFMSGDRYMNSCSILEFSDGSRVSFMCGSMGSHCLWKEYMECFSRYCSITISEFTDMRVRGLKGEFDRIYPPQFDECKEEIMKYGFDFFETYKVDQFWKDPTAQKWWQEHGLVLERVRRPTEPLFDLSPYRPCTVNGLYFGPDKGWVGSLEHFARCFIEGSDPHNADAHAGAQSTALALALLKSLEEGRPIGF
jgi:predicted dehydrogenase